MRITTIFRRNHHEAFSRWERRYTAIELLAGLAFLIGSVLFMGDSTKSAGTVAFIVGSALFVIGPAMKFMREYHLASTPIPGDGLDPDE